MHFSTFTQALTIGLLAASSFVVAQDTGALDVAKRFVGGSANAASAFVASVRALESREPHHKEKGAKSGKTAIAGAAANGTATTAAASCVRAPHHKGKACARDVEIEARSPHHKEKGAAKGGNAATASAATNGTATTATTGKTNCVRDPHHKGKACARDVEEMEARDPSPHHKGNAAPAASAAPATASTVTTAKTNCVRDPHHKGKACARDVEEMEARDPSPHHKGANAAPAASAAPATASAVATTKTKCARDPHHKGAKACARDFDEMEAREPAPHHKGNAALAASAAPATASTAATTKTKCVRDPHHKGGAAKACA
ncbi:uncharacterized protein BDZ99DRAFT_494001 [Mytilinidion resinicola]|uniref:Uncharacterized protein n=1 Tax=Mytilinidion resinicola TaxID=574789 RepID=A0A6A6Z734_9PEZI|nr:uncharacterized protein BDZ99DRAFT_494001 [Mytilinidion resinicola]KAF2816114.1 hypothetical protein BDZ99DRAFT_494001 [Mytilinidion resinicola]